MQQLVRIAIQTKLMKSAVIDGNSAEYRRPSPNNSTVKILTVWQFGEDEALNSFKVFSFPHFLKTVIVFDSLTTKYKHTTYLTKYDVILIAGDVFPNVLHSLVSVFGYSQTKAPAV